MSVRTSRTTFSRKPIFSPSPPLEDLHFTDNRVSNLLPQKDQTLTQEFNTSTRASYEIQENTKRGGYEQGTENPPPPC